MPDRSRLPLWGAILVVCSLALAAPAASQTCAGDAAWVSSPSQPNFAQDPPTICAFYQYAWQSFLYLT